MVGIVLSESLIRSLVDTSVESVKVDTVRIGGVKVKYRITGSTYPVKDILKRVGCRWSPTDKCWYTTNKDWRTVALEDVSGDMKNTKRIGKLTVEEVVEEVVEEEGEDKTVGGVIQNMVQGWKSEHKN